MANLGSFTSPYCRSLDTMAGRTRFDSGRTSQLRKRFSLPTVFLVVSVTLISYQEASALIEGGVGNKPLNDPGWPKGAAPMFNHPGRIAWWEGPPFGGGQWHTECRGDTKAFNALLVDYVNLDAKNKRIIVHDGVGQSFWLNMNREPAKQDAAK